MKGHDWQWFSNVGPVCSTKEWQYRQGLWSVNNKQGYRESVLATNETM